MQALAETMLDATGDTYVAGLWKSRIVEDVLWTTDVDDLPKGVAVRRPREWRAPTWSWASLDCKAEARSVYHYTGPLELSGKSFVSEMAPSVEGFAGVSTGQLRSASLQVRGLLYRNRFAFTMKTLESPLSLYRPADESTPWSFKIVLDEWDEEAVRGPEYSVPAGALFFTVGSPIAGTIEGLVLESVAERGYQFRRTAYFEADISYVSTEKILKGSGILENADKLDLLRDGEDVKGRLMYRFTLIQQFCALTRPYKLLLQSHSEEHFDSPDLQFQADFMACSIGSERNNNLRISYLKVPPVSSEAITNCS